MFYNIEHRSKAFWLDVAKCGNPDWISKAGPNQIVSFWRKITSQRLIFDARRTPTRWPNLFSLLLHHLWLSSCQLSPPLSFFSISSSLTCIAHLVRGSGWRSTFEGVGINSFEPPTPTSVQTGISRGRFIDCHCSRCEEQSETGTTRVASFPHGEKLQMSRSYVGYFSALAILGPK